MDICVYILRDRQNRLYIGQTNRLSDRVVRHNQKRGSKYTASHLNDCELVYSEQLATRTEAMRREKQLKGWTRAKKEALIAGDLTLLKKL